MSVSGSLAHSGVHIKASQWNNVCVSHKIRDSLLVCGLPYTGNAVRNSSHHKYKAKVRLFPFIQMKIWCVDEVECVCVCLVYLHEPIRYLLTLHSHKDVNMRSRVCIKWTTLKFVRAWNLSRVYNSRVCRMSGRRSWKANCLLRRFSRGKWRQWR